MIENNGFFENENGILFDKLMKTKTIKCLSVLITDHLFLVLHKEPLSNTRGRSQTTFGFF